jgi:indolepyruvate ferredoxin oxidoreductase beta subunit
MQYLEEMIMSHNNYTIVITGLGGQGLIKLLQILGDSLVRKGYKVITSEKHGLSQRGGMVTCFLRFGEKLAAPIPIVGSADMIIASEKSCVLNVLQYANPNGSTKIIISEYKKAVLNSEYPADKYISDILKNHSNHLNFLSIENLPKNQKAANIFILGYILKFLPIEKDDIELILMDYFSEEFQDLNQTALINGINYHSLTLKNMK